MFSSLRCLPHELDWHVKDLDLDLHQEPGKGKQCGGACGKSRPCDVVVEPAHDMLRHILMKRLDSRPKKTRLIVTWYCFIDTLRIVKGSALVYVTAATEKITSLNQAVLWTGLKENQEMKRAVCKVQTYWNHQCKESYSCRMTRFPLTLLHYHC